MSIHTISFVPGGMHQDHVEEATPPVEEEESEKSRLPIKSEPTNEREIKPDDQQRESSASELYASVTCDNTASTRSATVPLPQTVVIDASSSDTALGPHARYCDVCKVVVPHWDIDAHMRTILHNFETQRLTPSERRFVLEDSKGYQLLRDLGWNGRSGLGAALQGRQQPIATRLKPNRLGVGHQSQMPLRVTHFAGEDEAGARRPVTAAEAIANAQRADNRRKRNDKPEAHLSRAARKKRRLAETKRAAALHRAVYLDNDHEQLLRGTHPSQRGM